jgi:hypothetical protein
VHLISFEVDDVTVHFCFAYSIENSVVGREDTPTVKVVPDKENEVI